MNKRIVNADDFGASPSVNQAIDYAFKNGIINQATLMVNMPHVQDAVYKAIRGGYMDKIGLHLCLDAGEPLTEAVKEYHLFDTKVFWQNKINSFFVSTKVRKAIRQEIEAQIQKYLQLGCTLMHIDSHHHLHHTPSILPLVVSLAKKYGFKSMRVSRNMGHSIKPMSRVIKAIINWYIARNFETSSYFGSMQNWRETPLSNNDCFEIMVHPCIQEGKYVDWINFGVYYSLDDYDILK